MIRPRLFVTSTLRGPLPFIVLTVLLDAIGIGIIIPVMPGLVTELSHLSLEQAASIGGILLMTYALAQFLFAPVIGGLSDAYGRRPVLLLAVGGFAVNMLICATTPVLWLLFVSRFLSGAAGASYSTAYAYIADVTPPARRAGTYGLLGVAFGVGFILGPAIGGLVGDISVRAPFFVAAALAVTNLTIGIFHLPESLGAEHRRPFDIRHANPIGSMRRLVRLGPALRRLALVYFLWMLATQAMYGVWPFVAAARYAWTAMEVGLSLTVVGLFAIIVNGLLVRRFVDGTGETATALIGLASGTAGYLVQVFADTGVLAYVAFTVGALGGLAVPALQGLMTGQVAASGQGELQGALATLSSLSIIIGPPTFAGLFTWFAGPAAPVYAPGAPFLLSTGLALLALVTLFATRLRRPLARG